MSNNKKTILGQFYTDNYDYILNSLWKNYIKDHIVEPFVGKGDLIQYLKDKKFDGEMKHMI